MTGRTDNFEPRRVALTWGPLTATVAILAMPVLTLSVPMGLFLMNRYFTQNLSPVMQQLQNMKLLPIAWIAACQIATFSGIMISPRGILTTDMHNSVKRRIRRYKFDAFITGILAATFSFGAVAFTISRESAPKITLLAMGGAAVLGLIAGVWRWASIRKSRREFRGLELKVVGYDAGQFEVVGLTTEFLEALGLCAIRYKQ